MNIKRYKCNISIYDLKIMINGGVDMATVSLERNIVLSPKAVKNLVKIVNEPSKYEKKQSSNVMNEIEEGKKILKQLLSR